MKKALLLFACVVSGITHQINASTSPYVIVPLNVNQQKHGVIKFEGNWNGFTSEEKKLMSSILRGYFEDNDQGWSEKLKKKIDPKKTGDLVLALELRSCENSLEIYPKSWSKFVIQRRIDHIIAQQSKPSQNNKQSIPVVIQFDTSQLWIIKTARWYVGAPFGVIFMAWFLYNVYGMAINT